jgi:hypothetical protein
MRRSSTVTSLSTRARAVIRRILFGDTPVIVEPTRAEVRTRLESLARYHKDWNGNPSPLDVWQLLNYEKNCGKVTATEILAWIGHKNQFSHVHVCRECGRKFA